jgi:hypothetical protein
MFSPGGIGALGGSILVRCGGRGGSWSLGGDVEVVCSFLLVFLSWQWTRVNVDQLDLRSVTFGGDGS